MISGIPFFLKVNRLEIGVILVAESRIKALNQQFLHNKYKTDILCFAPERNYAELIICAGVAREQARVFQHSLEEEILYLIIHGLLHLSGYRDYARKDYLKMKKKQDDIFARVMQKAKKRDVRVWTEILRNRRNQTF